MKKRIIFLIGSITIAIIILISTTYSLFYKNDKLANSNNYATGNLDIVLENNETGLGNTISLDNAIPLTDSEGKNSTPYQFKITNTGNLDYKFDLYLNSSGTLNPSYIRIQVNDNEPINLTGSNTKIMSNMVLYAGQSEIVSVKFWMDKNTPSDGVGKTFNASLSTNGIGVKVTASEKIITLAGDCNSWNAGFSGICATNSYDDNGVTKYHDYRYIGTDVNNYVKFNNDMYQIIGVFDDYTHGVTGKKLVKLISVNSTDAFSWGMYKFYKNDVLYAGVTNDWSGDTTGYAAGANVMLNNYFLGQNMDSPTYGSCYDWSYVYQGSNGITTSKTCNHIVNYGISKDNLNYIEKVKWSIKGFNEDNYYNSKQNWYKCEREETENCGGANNGKYSSTYNAKIGLMYASDYLYACGGYASTNTSASNYSNNGRLNWLLFGQEWLMNVVTSSSSLVYQINNGGVNYLANTNGLGVRPVFYLKNDTYFSDGDGSFDNPYIIGNGRN